jgi:putative PIN family toxin of toxin-antitoxin system
VPAVVLDTNIILSALIFNGDTPRALRKAWQRRRLQALVSKVTVTELIRVLAYPKFHIDADDREQLLADYLPYCRVVTVPPGITGLPICRDPFDPPLLELAAAGNTDYRVTGDQDLLVIADSLPFTIVTASELLSRLRDG